MSFEIVSRRDLIASGLEPAARAAWRPPVMSRPLLLIDRCRRIRFANAAARSWIANTCALRVNDDRLELSQPAADRTMGLVMKSLHDGASTASARPTDRQRSQIVFTDPEMSIQAIVRLSLAADYPVVHFSGERGLVEVAVFLARARPTIDAQVVRSVFDLTGAEAAIVTRVAEGQCIDAIVTERRTSLATVRTQLQTAMHKLRVNRQVELVCLLAGNPAFWRAIPA